MLVRPTSRSEKKCLRVISSEQYNSNSCGANRNETLTVLEHTRLFLSCLFIKLCPANTISLCLLRQLINFLERYASLSVCVFRTPRVWVIIKHRWEGKIRSTIKAELTAWASLEKTVCVATWAGWAGSFETSYAQEGAACLPVLVLLGGRGPGESIGSRIGPHKFGAQALNHRVHSFLFSSLLQMLQTQWYPLSRYLWYLNHPYIIAPGSAGV